MVIHSVCFLLVEAAGGVWWPPEWSAFRLKRKKEEVEEKEQEEEEEKVEEGEQPMAVSSCSEEDFASEVAPEPWDY